MTYVTRHIDWLSVTVSEASDFRMDFPLLGWRYVGSGLHGYRARYVSAKTGMEYQTDNSDKSIAPHYTVSGSALVSLRQDFGATDGGIVNQFVRMGGKATRIDLSINIHEGQLTPRKIQQAVKSGSAKPKANVNRFIEGKNGEIEGDTFYIGSPQSDRQMRAYNKSAEMGIVDGQAWLRLELELRRIRANNAFRSCSANGVDATVAGHMGDFLKWRNVEYQAALGQQSVPPVDIPRKDTNRQRWLLSQVAQALAKEICVDEDFALKFWSSVNQSVDDIKSAE